MSIGAPRAIPKMAHGKNATCPGIMSVSIIPRVFRLVPRNLDAMIGTHDTRTPNDGGNDSMQRKFLRRLAGATAGLVLTGTSTFAADLGVAPLAPPPPPVFTWTGFELGVQVGGGAGRTTVHVDGNSAPFPLLHASDAYTSSGVFGGIHVGYNYQFSGPIVAGVQLEYNFAGITGTASAPPLNYLNTAIRQFGSAEGRLGVAFHRLLIYAIGGSPS